MCDCDNYHEGNTLCAACAYILSDSGDENTRYYGVYRKDAHTGRVTLISANHESDYGAMQWLLSYMEETCRTFTNRGYLYNPLKSDVVTATYRLKSGHTIPGDTYVVREIT